MDGKRMIGRRTTWLAVILGVMGLVIGTKFPEFNSSLTGGSWYKMAEKALTSKTVVFFVPIVAVLPYGDVWIGEKTSGFLRFYVTRKGKKEYTADRLFTTILSSCFAWTSAIAVTLLFYFALFYPMEVKSEWKWVMLLPLLQSAARLLLVAAVLADLSGIMAVVSGSVYMAYGIPFAGYYLLTILHERYLESVYVIDPQSWIKGAGDWGKDSMGIWLFLILLVFLTASLYGGLLYGRCREL